MHMSSKRLIRALMAAFLALPSVALATPLSIAAALDRPAIAPVLAAFEAAHPEIDVHYADLSTRAVERRTHDAAHPPDVVISSAMPSQMAAANAGFAARLTDGAARAWPARFKWRNTVFGFTFEPVVLAYRADQLPPDMDLHSHGALFRALIAHRSRLCGRVAIYDPARSAVGYALYRADAGHTARFWQLVSALGSVDAQEMPTTKTMLDGLSSGRFVLAYNLIGSYARQYAATHPHIELVETDDYTLVLSRMVFVHRRAPHPIAARRFVNYLLSPAGQRVLARQTALSSPLPGVRDTPDAARFMPIALDAGLLAQADDSQRQRDLAQWAERFTASDIACRSSRSDPPR